MASDEPNPFNAQLGAEPLLVTPTTPAPRDDIPDASTGPTGNGKPGAKQLEGPQSAALVVEKIAPGELQVGKAVTVEIQVRNVGTATAHDVVLRDEIPRGAQLVGSRPRAERENGGELVWKIGAIQPGEKISVYCELMPTTEGELGSVATVHYAAAASSRSVVTRPELALEVAAPSEVLIGDPVSFRIKVSNPGTGVATGVVLSSRVPANLDHPAGEEIEYEIGNLRPGESKMLELSMRASQAGTAMNIIVARGDGALQADRQTPVTVIAPALEVAMEGSRKRFLDRQATYTLSVANPGTASAKEVELVAYLPPGLEFVEANNQGHFDKQARTVHWLLEELPAQEKGSVSLTVLPTEAGSQMVKIAGKAERGLSVEKPESINIEGVATVIFQVTDQADPVEQGGETTYDINVVNQGTKAAGTVQIVAHLPSEMQLLSAEGPTRYEVVGSQIRFQELPRLAPKSQAMYRLKVRCAQAGDMRVRVQLTSDEIRTPITKEESTRVLGDE
jgi:uncharacterized repeat protein (TIGR01451 family)